MTIPAIIKECGLSLRRFTPVRGGDISSSYCIETEEGRFFLKLNKQSGLPGMFAKEARGLAALQATQTVHLPGVIGQGVRGNDQYLLLEWLDAGIPQNGSWERLGRELAALHQVRHTSFGWKEDNYIGNLQQTNTPQATWGGFYASCRVLPLVKQLADRQDFSKNDTALAGTLCGKLSELFPPEPPALLHGDLWSGNCVVTTAGSAVVYDPAVYAGHREMDLAMTLLFGGFPAGFYEAYNEVYARSPGWKQRVALCQLYPLLVHALLFGGHYIRAARSVLQAFA